MCMSWCEIFDIQVHLTDLHIVLAIVYVFIYRNTSFSFICVDSSHADKLSHGIHTDTSITGSFLVNNMF